MNRYEYTRLQYFFRRFSGHLGMAVWGVLAPWYPISLIILIVLQTSEGFVLRAHPPTSLKTPQVIARTKQILEHYTGVGAP